MRRRPAPLFHRCPKPITPRLHLQHGAVAFHAQELHAARLRERLAALGDGVGALGGDEDGGGGVRGDGDVEGEFAAALLPCGLDAATDAVVADVGAGQLAAGRRGDDDSLVGDAARPDRVVITLRVMELKIFLILLFQLRY